MTSALKRAVQSIRRLVQPLAGGRSPLLYTDRLRLRVFEFHDWMPLCSILGDAEVLRYLARTEPYGRDEVFEYLCSYRDAMRLAPTSALMFAIVRKSDDVLIGDCGVSFADPEHPHLLSFVLRRDAWGSGYAVEAAAAVMRHAFEELGVPRILAGCHPGNGGSRRVLEKLRMRALPPEVDFPWSPAGVTSLVFEARAKEWLALPVPAGRTGAVR